MHEIRLEYHTSSFSVSNQVEGTVGMLMAEETLEGKGRLLDANTLEIIMSPVDYVFHVHIDKNTDKESWNSFSGYLKTGVAEVSLRDLIESRHAALELADCRKFVILSPTSGSDGLEFGNAMPLKDWISPDGSETKTDERASRS